MNLPAREAIAQRAAEWQPRRESVDRRDQWIAMLGVYGTMALLGLESTATGLVLPQAARELDGLPRYATIGTVASVASTVSILFAARLGDWIGRKPVLLLSVVLLFIADALSGLAANMPQLIAARALAGIATGMVTAAAVTAPADVFDDPVLRIRWQSFSSVVFAIASSIGPLLGGAVTALLGWRAGFFVVPLAALLCLGLLARFPRLASRHGTPQAIDWPGGVLLALTIAPPLVALNIGFGPAAQPALAAALVLLGAVALVLFMAHERRTAAPFLPLRVFATREARVLVSSTLVSGAAMLSLMFYGPLLLQGVVGLSPTHAGALMTPMLIALPVGSLVNGHLFRRQSRPERLLLTGLGLLALGSGALLIVAATGHRATAVIVAGFALAGLGLGMVQPNQSVFMQMLVQRHDLGVATGLISMTRNVGSALGAAVIGIAIASTTLAHGLGIGLALLLVSSVAMLLVSARMIDVGAPAFRRHHS